MNYIEISLNYLIKKHDEKFSTEILFIRHEVLK